MKSMGLFSAECHGGARWHVGIMNRRESPFEETALLRELMPNVLLQTLIRETNLWGYRPYPKNVIEYAVATGGHRCLAVLLLPERCAEHAHGRRGRDEAGTAFRADHLLHHRGLGHERILSQA